MSKINFFEEDAQVKRALLKKHKQWLKQVASSEDVVVDEINYIFCSDNYLLEVNRNYLNHDYYTDIITFDNSEDEKILSDIFISIDRINENSVSLGTSFIHELSRVMVHGLLHLCGYHDKSTNDKTLMREKEDHYLSLLPEN